MKILVLGGTGFLGPYVVRYLSKMGHDVTIFHTGKHEPDLPPQVKHIHSPLATRVLREIPDEVRNSAPEAVLHMVPVGERDARLVVDAFKGVAARLVAISSQDVYRAHGRLLLTEPGPPDPIPLTEDSPLREKLYPYLGETSRSEDDPMRWIDDYDKILVERIVLGERDLPGTVLRLPRVYGPGDNQHRLFPYLKRMDDGRPAVLLDDGVAAQRVSWSYVENVAWAIALAVHDQRASGRIYNVAETEGVSQREWVGQIAAAVGWNGEVIAVPKGLLPMPYDVRQHSVADDSRIREELGYSEPVPHEEALRRTIAWERANPPDKIDPADFDYATEDAILMSLGRAGS
jgi:nucleoside-diphosphate-sugar epimerase